MGKLLSQLSFPEVVQELARRNLSTSGTENELRERLELWVFRNGHEPKDYQFLSSLDSLCAELTVELQKTRDERRVILYMETKLRGDLQKFQETMISRMESLERKLEEINSREQQAAGFGMDYSRIKIDLAKELKNHSRAEKPLFDSVAKRKCVSGGKYNLSSPSSFDSNLP